MCASARSRAALGRVFLRLLAGAAPPLLAAASALAIPTPSLPSTPEGRPSFRFFSSEQGLPQNTPQAFALDARGFLWAGTQDGAAVYNGRIWKTVDMPNREESNNITDIQAGADGSMWFATTIGLARLNKGQWTLFRKEAGLPSNRILSLAEERDGSRTVLWAGRTRGSRDGTARPGRCWTPVPPTFPTNESALSSLSRRTRDRSSGSGPAAGSRAGRAVAGRRFPRAAACRRPQ